MAAVRVEPLRAQGHGLLLHELLGDAARVVVCAPHPDDEVLGCGGLLALCARARVPVVVVCVTDGEACYPGNPDWSRAALRVARRAELRQALHALGLRACRVRRCAVPDGGIAAAVARVTAHLLDTVRPDDAVFSTAAFDGHPDHEATCLAARQACETSGARLFEYPIWAGIWSDIDPGQLATRQRVELLLDPAAMQAKRTAIECFATQLGTSTPAVASPVLPPGTLQRFLLSTEIFFR
jgi:LmbE family N-acetylglucosaminyl deacetylase